MEKNNAIIRREKKIGGGIPLGYMDDRFIQKYLLKPNFHSYMYLYVNIN